MIRLVSFLILCAMLGMACQTQETASEPAVEFVANPQAVPEQTVETLPLGADAPDFHLPGTDGKWYALQDFADAKALAIVFTCNHCPTAQAYEERLIQLNQDYAEQGLAVIAISPNSPLGLLYEELGYSDLGDTYEDMVLRDEGMNFPFPYLYDGDDHAASLQYGPVATPHFFLFDEGRKLRYVGRMDKSEAPGTANSEDARAAIEALLAGEEVATPETKTFGCSTKWAWKTKWKDKVNADWAALPVAIGQIDTSGIRDLLANDSDKLRLINIWATWCGPCVLEYPEFIAIHRMFKGRDFEFVSLSADRPEQEGKALEFLQKQQSAVQNYLFSQDDKYALIEAIDPNWNGALPYTLLIEPGGKIAYAHQGSIDPLELKRAIVDHPMIGRYF
ncbi:MAG: redoxin domain-containing protein [Bacteroidota bacterium]